MYAIVHQDDHSRVLYKSKGSRRYKFIDGISKRGAIFGRGSDLTQHLLCSNSWSPLRFPPGADWHPYDTSQHLDPNEWIVVSFEIGTPKLMEICTVGEWISQAEQRRQLRRLKRERMWNSNDIVWKTV